jgi:hypothetical protein
MGPEQTHDPQAQLRRIGLSNRWDHRPSLTVHSAGMGNGHTSE